MKKGAKKTYAPKERLPAMELADSSLAAFASVEPRADAAAPFAFIQPNATIPATNLNLSPLQAGWELVGQATWNATISYTDHSRNDQTPILGSSSVWTPILIDFQGEVQGGNISLSVAAQVRNIKTGAANNLSWSGTSTIRGLNPAKADLKSRLGDLQSQVIAFKESTFAQFGGDNLPLFNGPNGFGVMQLDNSPSPTARQIWDWTQNVDGGKSKFTAGQQTIRQHYANLIAAHSKLPALTADQIKVASYEYYNAGNQGFYWTPNATFDGWVKNPNSNFTTYGDDAVRVEGLINAGTPPAGWN
jgi:hypothetical protein